MSASERTSRRWSLVPAAALAAAAAWIYRPAFRGDWLWDDTSEIVQNPVLRDPAGLGKIWSGADGPDYFPLKTTVEWAQWHLWGDARLGYHLTNVGLHVLSALLIFKILKRLNVRSMSAWVGAAFFVVHPVAVESVAWISELKNALALPLLLGAILAWMEYEGRAGRLGPPGIPAGSNDVATSGVGPAGRAGPPYLRAFACFTASLLCKTSGVMFPLILLLYVFWRYGRVRRRDLLAALPFFAVSLGLGLVTVWFQQHRAIAQMPLALGGMASRIAIAGMALVFYFAKAVCPWALSLNYPRWSVAAVGPVPFLPWVVVIAGLIFLRNRRGWRLGFAVFGLSLLPVLGLVPMSYLRISWVADHFAYLALAGLAVGVGMAWARVEGVQPPQRGGLHLLAGVVLVGLAVQSHQYARTFRNEEALWTQALLHNPASWTAENDLGKVRFQQGRRGEAAAHFQRALELNPTDAEAHFNLGLILADAGRWDEAAAHAEAALRIRPGFPEAHNTLGNARLRAGRLPEAIAHFQAALQVRPDYPEAHANLGVALASGGRLPEAMAEFTTALRLNPGYAEAAYNLGLALGNAGRLPEAIARYEQALRAKPDYAEARNNLGVAFIRTGRLAEAAVQFEAALRLDPGFAQARENLAAVRAELARGR